MITGLQRETLDILAPVYHPLPLSAPLSCLRSPSPQSVLKSSPLARKAQQPLRLQVLILMTTKTPRGEQHRPGREDQGSSAGAELAGQLACSIIRVKVQY
jgi:hypothetical protein